VVVWGGSWQNIGVEVALMNGLSFSAAVILGLGVGGAVMAQDAAMHAPDGGTQQHVESIAIPALQNAPFSAVVTTELTTILPDGSKRTVRNHRTVARDGSGRVFQERRFFTPDGDKQVTRLGQLEYQDPNQHRMVLCRPVTQVCTVYRWDAPTAVSLQKAGPLPNGMGEVTQEALGQKTIEDLNVMGSREVTTIKAGAIGNEKAEPVVKEFWYSPHLQINVITKRFDPRASAIQNFEVGNIRLAEPDPKMFEPPVGYRMVQADGQ
jgi:hypothetical protein